MVDAWKQSFIMLPPSTPLQNRISWAHRRASIAMLVTSFTTSAVSLSQFIRRIALIYCLVGIALVYWRQAFLSNAVNYVIPVALFGVFMALLGTAQVSSNNNCLTTTALSSPLNECRSF